MASQVVAANVSATVSCAQTQASGVIASFQIPASISRNFAYTNGNAGGAGVVDQLYSKQLTLSGSATTISLTSLTDVAGNAITPARIRELIVENITTTAGYDLKVEAGATNGVAWLPASTQPIYARAGSGTNYGRVQISDPMSTGSGNGNVVTAGSTNMTLDPGSNTIVCNVIILGTSVA